MASGLILASNEFTVIGDWVDGVTVVDESSLSFNESVLFVLRGKTFNESSARCTLDGVVVVVVITSIAEGNDDDATVGAGTFVFDCNDNVVISEAGVEGVVAISARQRRKEMRIKMLNKICLRCGQCQMTKTNQSAGMNGWSRTGSSRLGIST